MIDAAIVGIGRRRIDDETFRKRLREGLERYSRRGPADEESWGIAFSAPYPVTLP